jgi:HK97 family phage prohead protease
MADLSTRAILTGTPERRSYAAEYEVRGLANSRVELRGYASVFGTPYEMHDMFGEYSENVQRGAFATTLANRADVAYLANHSGLTMARTIPGSLRLSEDTRGLHTVAQVNTTRGDVRDLVAAIEDGDVDQMSMGFRVVTQEWSSDYSQRTMVALDLHRGDVSAVNYGASPTTSVSTSGGSLLDLVLDLTA